MGYGAKKKKKNLRAGRAERGMGARKKGRLWSLHVWYRRLLTNWFRQECQLPVNASLDVKKCGTLNSLRL